MQLQKISIGEIKPTKFGIDLMAEAVAEDINSGKVKALDAAIQLNALEQFIKSLKGKIAEQVLTELALHPKSKAEINGVQVSEMCAIKYDFSDNKEWAQIDAEISKLDEKKKEIEDFEKKFHKGNLAVKSATTTYKINIPK